MQQQYTVTIKTGDIRWAGTDARVYITLHGDKGSTAEQYLDRKGNDFERDSQRDYVFKGIDIGTPEQIRLRHDNTRPGEAWYVDWVKVRNAKNQGWVFPCYSWLDEDGEGIDRFFTVEGGIPSASIIDGKIKYEAAGKEIKIFDHRDSGLSEKHQFTFTQQYTQTVTFDKTESMVIGGEFGLEVSVPIKAIQLGINARKNIEKTIQSKFGLIETKSSEAKHIHEFTVTGKILYVATTIWTQRVQFGHVKRGERYLPFRAALGLKQDIKTYTFLKGQPLPPDIIDAMKKLGLPV